MFLRVVTFKEIGSVRALRACRGFVSVAAKDGAPRPARPQGSRRGESIVNIRAMRHPRAVSPSRDCVANNWELFEHAKQVGADRDSVPCCTA